MGLARRPSIELATSLESLAPTQSKQCSRRESPCRETDNKGHRLNGQRAKYGQVQTSTIRSIKIQFSGYATLTKCGALVRQLQMILISKPMKMDSVQACHQARRNRARCRRRDAPTMKKPVSIVAQVAGSGTAGGAASSEKALSESTADRLVQKRW